MPTQHDRDLAQFMRQASHANLRKPPTAGHATGVGGFFHSLAKHTGVSGVKKYGGRAVSQFAKGMEGSITGIPEVARTVGHDVIHHPLEVNPITGGTAVLAEAATGHNQHLRTAKLIRGIGKQTYEDFAHPGRNPGYLAWDLVSLLSMGAGSAAKLGRVGSVYRALRAGEDLPKSMGGGEAESGAIPRKPKPGGGPGAKAEKPKASKKPAEKPAAAPQGAPQPVTAEASKPALNAGQHKAIQRSGFNPRWQRVRDKGAEDFGGLRSGHVNHEGDTISIIPVRGGGAEIAKVRASDGYVIRRYGPTLRTGETGVVSPGGMRLAKSTIYEHMAGRRLTIEDPTAAKKFLTKEDTYKVSPTERQGTRGGEHGAGPIETQKEVPIARPPVQPIATTKGRIPTSKLHGKLVVTGKKVSPSEIKKARAGGYENQPVVVHIHQGTAEVVKGERIVQIYKAAGIDSVPAEAKAFKGKPPVSAKRVSQRMQFDKRHVADMQNEQHLKDLPQQLLTPVGKNREQNFTRTAAEMDAKAALEDMHAQAEAAALKEVQVETPKKTETASKATERLVTRSKGKTTETLAKPAAARQASPVKAEIPESAVESAAAPKGRGRPLKSTEQNFAKTLGQLHQAMEKNDEPAIARLQEVHDRIKEDLEAQGVDTRAIEPIAPVERKVGAVPENSVPKERAKPNMAGKIPVRQLKLNPRDFEDKIGLERGPIANKLRTRIKRMYEANRAAGEKDPSAKDLKAVFHDVLGEGPGDEMFSKWVGPHIKGGAGGVSFEKALVGAISSIFEPYNPGVYKLGHFEREVQGKTLVYDVNVNLSRNPLVRAVQQWRYGLIGTKDPNFVQRMLAPVTDEKLKRIVTREIEQQQKFVDVIEAGGLYAKSDKEFNKIIGDIVKRRRREAEAVGTRAGLGDWIDTTNELAIIGTLFLKPAYLTPNLLGQALLVMADHHMNPINMAQSIRLAAAFRRFDKQAFSVVQGQMGQGMMAALEQGAHQTYLENIKKSAPKTYAKHKGPIETPPKGVTIKGKNPIGHWHRYLANMYSKLLDTPWRDISFYHEARRHGFDTPEKLQRLTRDIKMNGKFREISQRANLNIIKFGDMTEWERKYVQRAIFFYPWIRASSLYSLRFMTEHPFQSFMVQHLQRSAEDHIRQELGLLPSYSRNLYPEGTTNVRGLGKVPEVRNWTSASIMGSLGDLIQGGQALLGHGTDAESVQAMENPFLTMASAVVQGKDPFTDTSFTGKSAPWIIAHEAQQYISPLQAYQKNERAKQYASGEKSTANVLYPYKPGQPWERWAIGLSKFPVNPKEARSRAIAERQAAFSNIEKQKTRADETFRTWQQGASEVGVGKLPNMLKAALYMDAVREANKADFKKKFGGTMDAKHSLYADVALAVRLGKITNAQGQQLITSYSALPDSQISEVASAVRKAYFGNYSEIISKYKSAINQLRYRAHLDPIK